MGHNIQIIFLEIKQHNELPTGTILVLLLKKGPLLSL
uniref:Uncharacterized protein n=1 Tax=Rhizophora mucronata TaxID=61149 RepID=A0A2P2QY74_RHIMU